jgi:hypothetical protein
MSNVLKKVFFVVLAICIAMLIVVPASAAEWTGSGTAVNYTLSSENEDGDTIAINIRTNGLNGSNLAFYVTLSVNGVETISTTVPAKFFGSGTFEGFVTIGGITVQLSMKGNDYPGKNGYPTVIDGLPNRIWTEEGRLNPTCINDGYISYTSNLGETRTDVLPALKHDFSVLVSHKDATCVDAGYDVYKCSRCNVTETTALVVNADNHIGDTYEEVITAATCIALGEMGTYCSDCKALLDTADIAIDKSNHVGGTYEDVITAATCVEAGVMGICCNSCDAVLSTEGIPATGHNLGDWYEVYPPEFGKPGLEQCDCENCDYYETREIEMLKDPEWKPATKNDAYGTKIASNAQYFYPGNGISFNWELSQSGDGILVIDESFFSVYGHEKLTIVVKSSADVQYVAAEITVPGTYKVSVPKWADSKGKVHNINMVWIRIDNE